MKTNYSEVEARADEANMKIEHLHTRYAALQNEMGMIQENLRVVCTFLFKMGILF